MKKLLMVIPLVLLLCLTFGCQKAEEAAEEVKAELPAMDLAQVRQAIEEANIKFGEAVRAGDVATHAGRAHAVRHCSQPNPLPGEMRPPPWHIPYRSRPARNREVGLMISEPGTAIYVFSTIPRSARKSSARPHEQPE